MKKIYTSTLYSLHPLNPYFSWNLGDGPFLYGETYTRSYSFSDDYLTRLNVQNSNNSSEITSQTISATHQNANDGILSFTIIGDLVVSLNSKSNELHPMGIF